MQDMVHYSTTLLYMNYWVLWALYYKSNVEKQDRTEGLNDKDDKKCGHMLYKECLKELDLFSLKKRK